jgi:hypothetical protein
MPKAPSQTVVPLAGFTDAEKRLLSFMRLRYLQGGEVSAREVAHLRFVRWLDQTRDLEADGLGEKRG